MNRSKLYLLLFAAVLAAFLCNSAAYALEDWKAEFEDVCSKTQDAMTFNVDELKSLIARCDKLKPIIDGLGETERKVYGRRLQLCRDLLVFVLESKEKK